MEAWRKQAGTLRATQPLATPSPTTSTRPAKPLHAFDPMPIRGKTDHAGGTYRKDTATPAESKNGNGATFAAHIFLAAEKRRKNLEPSDTSTSPSA
jgi:hypothetical protein